MSYHGARDARHLHERELQLLLIGVGEITRLVFNLGQRCLSPGIVLVTHRHLMPGLLLATGASEEVVQIDTSRLSNAMARLPMTSS